MILVYQSINLISVLIEELHFTLQKRTNKSKYTLSRVGYMFFSFQQHTLEIIKKKIYSNEKLTSSSQSSQRLIDFKNFNLHFSLHFKFFFF